MIFLKKIIFVFIFLKFFRLKTKYTLKDLNFRKIDFTNYKQTKSFIFKKDFFKLKNKNIHSFDFLNYSQSLGGKIGINLSKNSIINWNKINKNKINFPWVQDLTAKRLINIIYNFEFIDSSSTVNEKRTLEKIINIHMKRVIFDFNNKNITEISSYEIVANYLSLFLLNKISNNMINNLHIIINVHTDKMGMHKSYNVLEHAKYINNLNELKNIFLFFNYEIPKTVDDHILKMKSILNQYFHKDGTLPLFNGSNNNYTNLIFQSINKEEYLKSRVYPDNNNGIVFYSDKNKSIFFDTVQPNQERISSNLNAGTLSFEFSCLGEKIITNCGATESFGKNPEYLRYTAAHSTIVLQNTNISEIKENNPHIKFPQLVTFSKNDYGNGNTIFEGSHNGYLKKFNKIIKRKLKFNELENKLYGEDTIISVKNRNDKVIYHTRFHLNDKISYNFTNNKKSIILRTKLKQIWLFKSNTELIVEDSILVDNNKTIPTKQIVIKGVLNKNKQENKWLLEKI